MDQQHYRRPRWLVNGFAQATRLDSFSARAMGWQMDRLTSHRQCAVHFSQGQSILTRLTSENALPASNSRHDGHELGAARSSAYPIHPLLGSCRKTGSSLFILDLLMKY